MSDPSGRQRRRDGQSLQFSWELAQPGPGWVTGPLSAAWCSVSQKKRRWSQRTAKGAVTYNDCRVVTRDILLPRPPPPQPSLQTLVESPSSSLPTAGYGKCGEESREAEAPCPRSQSGSSSLIRRLESRARFLVPSLGHLREYIIIFKLKHLLLIFLTLCVAFTPGQICSFWDYI